MYFFWKFLYLNVFSLIIRFKLVKVRGSLDVGNARGVVGCGYELVVVFRSRVIEMGDYFFKGFMFDYNGYEREVFVYFYLW